MRAELPDTAQGQSRSPAWAPGGSRAGQGRLTWCWSVCPRSGCRCHSHRKGEGRAFRRTHPGPQLHGGSRSLNRSTADHCNETHERKSHSEQKSLPVQMARSEMVPLKSPRSHFCDLTGYKSLHSFPLLPPASATDWVTVVKGDQQESQLKEEEPRYRCS